VAGAEQWNACSENAVPGTIVVDHFYITEISYLHFYSRPTDFMTLHQAYQNTEYSTTTNISNDYYNYCWRCSSLNSTFDRLDAIPVSQPTSQMHEMIIVI